MSEKDTEYCDVCEKYVRPNVYWKHHGDNCRQLERQKAKITKRKAKVYTYEIFIKKTKEVIATYESIQVNSEDVFSTYLREAIAEDKEGAVYDKIRNNIGNITTRIKK